VTANLTKITGDNVTLAEACYSNVEQKFKVRFEAFMAVKIQDEFFWVMTPCSVVVGY